MMGSRRRAFLGLLAGLCFLAANEASATIPLVEGETVQFGLGGYVRDLSGYQHLPYDTAGLVDPDAGLNSAITRFEWGLNLGSHVTLTIHNRFFWQLNSSPALFTGGALGLGATTPPGRTVDLESHILDDDAGRYVFTHDVDRLVLRLFLDHADVSLGRQAITWGNSFMFLVADLWTQFSPYELDTSQKPGIDAARVITSVGDRVELDFILADKGSLEFLSGGLRANLFLERADVYVAAAKIWNEVFLFAGASADLKTLGLRLEGALPWHLDDEEIRLPRITAGLDYYGTDWTVIVEVSYNGAGTDDSAEYLATFNGEALSRGETYFVGRYYAGVFADYKITELLHASLSAIVNLLDPSVIFTPTLSYDVAQNADIQLGAYVPAGSHPVLEAMPPRVESEFGTYGQLYFLQMSAYF